MGCTEASGRIGVLLLLPPSRGTVCGAVAYTLSRPWVHVASARLQGQLAGQAFRKSLPLDRVLVERSAVVTVTKGGMMLPEKAQGKVLQATVDTVGSGSQGKGGEIQQVSVKVGDKVLPEYGGTKVVLDDRTISYLEMVTFLESM